MNKERDIIKILTAGVVALAILNTISALDVIKLRQENEKLEKRINTLEEQNYTLESNLTACKWEYGECVTYCQEK